MLFHTLKFLWFFSVVFTVYWCLPRHRWRMGWLFVSSCAFYMSWNPWLISLILFSASVDYLVALRFEHVRSPGMRRFMLVGSICVNLGLLAFFKYVNFFLDTTWTLLAPTGLMNDRFVVKVLLPLGISFYTFETISYVVDVYRGKIQPVRNLLDYGLYIMFFPHLVAGPIVRPRDFLPQLRRQKRFNWDRLQLGAQFILLGLIKKVGIADHLISVVDPVFKSPGEWGSAAVWLAALAYSLQIYCDFSGYSDMAIGLAHMLGFHLPNNFHMPYFAGNITEFWRRWHISLSTWLRDYLYIPLGGNRNGSLATYRNLLITMLLGGLWHGANWTFVFWGFYHGSLLALHRVVPLPRWLGGMIFRPVNVALTFLGVTIGWVFFRAQTFGAAATMLSRMAWPTAGRSLAPGDDLVVLAAMLAVLVAHLFGTFVDVRRIERRLPAPVLGTALALLMVLLSLILRPGDGKGFIYFQF